MFGIRVGVDPSWFIILFLIIWSLSGYYEELFPGDDGKAFGLAIVSALLFFLSIVLHEFGHAIVAIRNGIEIQGIDLWMFGGLAKMKSDSPSAGVEFRVAVAGPLVTLAIAIACFAAGAAIAGGEDVWRTARFREEAGIGAPEAVLGYLAFINAVLLVFNLLPGFPLDGGRIARAIAWWRTGDRLKATRFAATLGRAFGYMLVGLGIFLFVQGSLIGGVWFAFIGFFLAQAARAAVAQTALSARIEGLSVADLMDAEPVAVPARERVDAALNQYFLRYGWPWFPVVDEYGRFVGVVTRDSIEGVPEAMRASWTVDRVASTDAEGALRVSVDAPVESLLGSEGLARLGALMAVDGNGILRGVITSDQVRRMLRPQTPGVAPPPVGR